MVKQETNKLKRLWIRFWYNDITRIFCVLLPVPSIILITILLYVQILTGQEAANVLITTYLTFLIWGIFDSDYSKLEKIGRDTNGRKKDKN